MEQLAQMEDNKSKLLVVGPYPPPYSGPESSMKLFLESPIRNHYNIRFLNMNFRKDNHKRGKIDLTSLAGIAQLLFRLCTALIVFRPHAVYYYVTATLAGWLLKDIWVIGLSRLFGCKIVIHMRAGHFRRNLDNAAPWQQKFIKFFIRRAAFGIVQANCLKNQFEGILPDNKIAAVYNMIDIKRYRRQNDMLDTPTYKIYFMGHLTYAKGYCDLLEALPQIVAAVPQVKLVCAGVRIQGNERNVLFNYQNNQKLQFTDPDSCWDKYIRGKFEKNFEYIGVLNEDQKIAQLSDCDAFILPSYSEGFSMAVLEALSMGCPVVTTPVGALQEIVHDNVNGLIVDCGDVQALAKAVIRILTDHKLRISIANNNHIYVMENFAQEIISNQLHKIFESIINK